MNDLEEVKLSKSELEQLLAMFEEEMVSDEEDNRLVNSFACCYHGCSSGSCSASCYGSTQAL